MVEHLELLPLPAAVGDGVLEHERGRARDGGELGRQLELGAEHRPLVDLAPDGEPVGGLALGDQVDLLRGQVGDPAVEGEVHRRLLARGVDEPVGPGVRRSIPCRSGRATR